MNQDNYIILIYKYKSCTAQKTNIFLLFNCTGATMRISKHSWFYLLFNFFFGGGYKWE